MGDSCPFLKKGSGKRGLVECKASVNFRAVGQARELCRLCPLSGGNWPLTCEFLEVYTFLHVEQGRQQIEARLDCRPLEDEVAECVWHREITQADVERRNGRVGDGGDDRVEESAGARRS